MTTCVNSMKDVDDVLLANTRAPMLARLAQNHPVVRHVAVGHRKCPKATQDAQYSPAVLSGDDQSTQSDKNEGNLSVGVWIRWW